jgi:hypothetical protein
VTEVPRIKPTNSAFRKNDRKVIHGLFVNDVASWTHRALRLPPNFRDVTAEKVGTVIGIIGATAAKATKPG